jgi:hypothetical protein
MHAADAPGHEGRDVVDGEGDLFSRPLLDEMRVGLNPGRDLARADVVEKGDVLPERSGEVALAQPLRQALADPDEDRHLQSGLDEIVREDLVTPSGSRRKEGLT